jgi:soluble lytic murein transglycosylase-like protein
MEVEIKLLEVILPSIMLRCLLIIMLLCGFKYQDLHSLYDDIPESVSSIDVAEGRVAYQAAKARSWAKMLSTAGRLNTVALKKYFAWYYVLYGKGPKSSLAKDFLDENPQFSDNFFKIPKGDGSRYKGFPLDFYSQHARKLAGEYDIDNPDSDAERTPELREMLQIAYFFMRIDERDLAKRILQHAAIFTAKDFSQKLYVCEFAKYMGFTDLSRQVAQKLLEVDGVAVFQSLYPHLSQMNNLDVDPKNYEKLDPMVHAVITIESKFNPNARSHSGASGLMQLMPDTARKIAPRINDKYDYARLYSDHNYNVRLGSKLLDLMFEKYNGDIILGLAAYNGGEGNVDRWIKQNGDPRDTESLDKKLKWIESIPKTETRNYVKKSLELFEVYKWLIHGVPLSPSYEYVI